MLEMLGPHKIEQGRGEKKFVGILSLIVSRGRENARKKMLWHLDCLNLDTQRNSSNANSCRITKGSGKMRLQKLTIKIKRKIKRKHEVCIIMQNILGLITYLTNPKHILRPMCHDKVPTYILHHPMPLVKMEVPRLTRYLWISFIWAFQFSISYV